MKKYSEELNTEAGVLEDRIISHDHGKLRGYEDLHNQHHYVAIALMCLTWRHSFFNTLSL